MSEEFMAILSKFVIPECQFGATDDATLHQMHH
jgi:hypothetical protein